ncbi:MAG TPA: hypothetical protein VLA05_12000 [Coriobacteriia bacterium]|nr:hypothetical protein [Coriobacteriia bacterium]
MRSLISRRVGLSLVLVVAMGLMALLPMAAVGAPPRFFKDMSGATWTAHLTGDDSMQGEAWMKKTPCGLGAFLQLKAPSVAGLPSEERLVLREDGEPDVLLATVGSDYPDFGIVIGYWPTGTPMFPDEPSPLFAQFESNKPYGAALAYGGPEASALPMQAEDFYAALDSGKVWVDVAVEGEIVLSGRICR